MACEATAIQNIAQQARRLGARKVELGISDKAVDALLAAGAAVRISMWPRRQKKA